MTSFPLFMARWLLVVANGVDFDCEIFNEILDSNLVKDVRRTGLNEKKNIENILNLKNE
jgi:hypothetical protein